MNAKQTSYFKIGLAVVLAIVFVGVMANSALTILRPSPPPNRQAAKSQPPPASPATHAAAPAPSAPVTAQAPSETLKDNSSKQAWPKFALDEIIAYDPFAIAKAADPAALSKSSAAAAGDTKTATAATDESKTASSASETALTGRIHTVYQRGGRTAALIGSKTIRPGDQLEGAGRVVEVDQSGLMLELKK
ncbi:MAG TPA: hypothetical protein VGI40_12690 [Pirellulaceae bacterium]|jgi:hypothetical protein